MVEDKTGYKVSVSGFRERSTVFVGDECFREKLCFFSVVRVRF